MLLVSIPLLTSSQSIKELDHSERYKRAGITTQKVLIERANGGECLDLMRAFDSNGRIVEEVKNFACGKPYSIETFEYDASGMLSRCTYAQVFMQFRELEFTLKFNEAGQLIERSLDEDIPQSWQKETFEYDAKGTMIKSMQWVMKNDVWTLFTEQEHLPSDKENVFRAKNTMSNVFDKHGLPLVQYRRGDAAQILATTKYHYGTGPLCPLSLE